GLAHAWFAGQEQSTTVSGRPGEEIPEHHQLRTPPHQGIVHRRPHLLRPILTTTLIICRYLAARRPPFPAHQNQPLKNRLRGKPHVRERGRRRCTAWRTRPSPWRPGCSTTTRPAAQTSPPRSPGTRASLMRRPRPGPRDRQPDLRPDGRVRDERARERPPGRNGRGAR